MAKRSCDWITDCANALNIEHDGKIGLHSLRRGAVQELLKNDADLFAILKAGPWNSKSFTSYLNKGSLQRDAMAKMLEDPENLL